MQCLIESGPGFAGRGAFSRFITFLALHRQAEDTNATAQEADEQTQPREAPVLPFPIGDQPPLVLLQVTKKIWSKFFQ